MIVILAIIALISTPIIIGVIEKARKGAFEDSAYGVLDAGRVYYLNQLMDEKKFEGKKFSFNEKADVQLLKLAGEAPAGGTLEMDTSGKVELAIYDKDKKWCAIKGKEEEKVSVVDYKKSNCDSTPKPTPTPVPTPESTGADTIVSENVSGNKVGLFTDDYGNTRYRGANPQNYVTFNNEVWRIIGVFDGKVKLIRDERIPNPNNGVVPYNASEPNGFYWDNHNRSTGAENDYGTNDWSISGLQRYLNNGYYNSIQNSFKAMIEITKYYLGGIAVNSYVNKMESYALERGTTVYSGRPTEWNGKIGLMYLSDYGYAAGEDCTQSLIDYTNINCRRDDWLLKTTYLQWTLTPSFSDSSYVAHVSYDGYAGVTHAGIYWLGVRPVVYLKSNVKITSGQGTSSDPYLLSIS